jgi:putative transposase
VIVAYIDAYRERFGVEPICRVLTEHGIPIAPSTYWAHRAQAVSDSDWNDAHMANRLLDLWRANRSVYGVDKLAAAARRAGLTAGRDQVGRLMAIVGISGAVRGQHRTKTTRSDPGAPRHPDRCGRAWGVPQAPDVWWVADFTYVWTLAGFVYVSFVTDVFSRRILGWRVSTRKTTPLVMAALEQALFTRRRQNARFTSTGLVFHSDAGSQYTSIAFTEALIEAGIAPSIGTVGDALDNALIGARRPAVAGQEQGSPRHHGPRPRHRSTAPANPRRHRSGPPRPCRSLGNHARSIRIGVRPGAGVNQLPRR